VAARNVIAAEAPYGSWESPIPIEALVTGVVRLGAPIFDRDDIYWLEGRPADAGRAAIVHRKPNGSVADVTRPGVNARSRVHEYGGGAYAVENSEIIYSNFGDGRLYRVPAGGGDAWPMSPEGPFRYADLTFDPVRDRLLAVREDHSGGGEPVNPVVAVPLDASAHPEVILEGTDFTTAPKPSPAGDFLAWTTWNHPNMPWDGMDLWLAPVDENGVMGPKVHVAGGPTEWTTAPIWSPDGVLHFASERTGWLQIYRRVHGRDELVTPIEAEFARPDWQFGQSAAAFSADGTLWAVGRAHGRDTLWAFGPDGAAPRRLDLPFTEIGGLRVFGARALFLAASPTQFGQLVLLDLASGEYEVLRRSTELQLDPAYLSVPEAISFPTAGGATAHGLFYAPKNPRFRAPAGERPPLVVTSHGGPTAGASSALSVTVQLLTSRGIAVLDVDYGGSTGYGRAYRKRLEGNWGIVDVEDCIAGARALADRGLVDRRRMAIEGGSSSGYTALAAVTFHDTFGAAVSYFGIGDLEALEGGHKFESRYTWGLIAPYPEGAATYRERSPIHFVERLRTPVLILQGLDDRVVPPDQATSMMAALAANGVPRAALYFEGEDHGFRKAENIVRSMEAELSFYGQVFGFTLADPIEPITLER
jgi:dipeptidyl aminopeptidase/acylaminoacyl peptidase